MRNTLLLRTLICVTVLSIFNVVFSSEGVYKMGKEHGLNLEAHYITDKAGNKLSVVLSVADYEALLNALAELQAKQSTPDMLVQSLRENAKDFADDDWDRQIRDDANSGKLDALFSEDVRAFEQGQCKPL